MNTILVVCIVTANAAVVIVLLSASLCSWLAGRVRKLECRVHELEIEVRSAEAQDKSRIKFIEDLQRKNAELCTRLDEARRRKEESLHV